MSAQRDTKKIQISSQYNGGAALAENDSENVQIKFVDPAEPSLASDFLNKIYDKSNMMILLLGRYFTFTSFFQPDLLEQNNVDADTTTVLVAHGADTGVDVRDNQRRAKAKLQGGFVVGSTTKVTRN